MHVERLGSGPRLVLVHGSVAPGWLTWNAQKPLADRFELEWQFVEVSNPV